jgi:transcriptional regulator GlxA family with amidase domain
MPCLAFNRYSALYFNRRRNFDRRFIRATGNTPLEYWQRVKVEAAKSNLEKEKITGISPLDYRAKYNREAILV